MSLRTLATSLLCADYLLGTLIIVAQLFGESAAVSGLFYATFFVTFALWMVTMVKDINRVDVLGLSIAVIALVNVVVNSAMTDTALSFEYLRKYFMFLSTLAFLSAVCKMHVSSKVTSFIAVLYLVVGLFLIAFFLLGRSAMFTMNGVASNYLTFRFTNPNLTGLFLSCMIMYLAVFAAVGNRRLLRVLPIALAAVESFFLYLTQSRNAILVTVVFLVLFVIVLARSSRPSRKLPEWLLALFAALPFVLAFLYLWLIGMPVVSDALSSFAGEGKGLDSRVGIWSQAFDTYGDSPVFGAYSQAGDATGMSQLHNTHIDVLVSYGPVILVLVIAFLYEAMAVVRDRGEGRVATVALFGFCCVLLLGFGEAALFSGGLGYYLHAAALLVLAGQRHAPDASVTPQ